MGLTFNLGRVSPSVFTDSSLNVGIGAAPSGSYKLEVTGTLGISGLFTSTAFGSSSFSAGGTGYNKLTIRNTTAGTGNGAQLSIGTNADPDQFYVQSFATTFTTSGMNIAGGAVVNGEGPGGLSIAATQSNIGFYTNGAGSANLRMTITSAGNVGIGLAAPGAPLEIIAGSATGTTTAIILTRALGYGSSQLKTYYNSGSDWGLIINTATESGGVKLVKDATSWAANTSDERKKKNFEPSQGLEELMKIEALKYHFEWDDDSIPKRMGFKAQNLLPLIPEMVLTTGDKAPDGSDYLTIIPDYLLPVLVKSIQELNERLNKAGL